MARRFFQGHSVRMMLCAGALCLAISAGCQRRRGKETPEALMREGWSSFRLEDFDAADENFAEALTALERAPGNDPEARRLRIIAMYGRGLAASLGRLDSAAAKMWLDKAVAADPGGSVAPWAALAVVRDLHMEGSAGVAALQTGYDAVIKQYPGSAAAEEAFLYRESLLVQTFSPDDARSVAADVEAWLKQGGPGAQGRLRTAMYGLLSRAYETLKQYPRALAAAIASLDAKENDPGNPNQNNMLEYYRIGMMAQYDVGDFATARLYFQRFLREYPNDQRAFNVRLMLRHMDDTEAALRRGEGAPDLAAEGGRP